MSELEQDNGASADADRATPASPGAAARLRHSGGIPSADDAFWGPEIVTDGFCPEWLGAREPYVWLKTNKWLDHFKERLNYGGDFAATTDAWIWRFADGRPNIVAIRLPADHPFYASAMSAGTAETAQQAQGQSPASAVPQGDAQNTNGASHV